ncbi:MAG: AsmA family protein [Candidatus Polarisedimenticolaceae bacterium]|nr:AsmA family protein [Candidatus Polarisedimenticolaceae bacterium]
MKLLKVFAGALGLVVVLMVAAIIIVPQVVDPNDFRDDIVAKVKETTGRDLQINGEIELSLFPWLGLELGELKLSNAKGFDAAPFASIQQAAVKVRIMPLLSKQVEVDTILLDGLHLNLAKARDGRTNWDDLAGAQKAQAGGRTTEPEPRSESADSTSAMPLAGLAIGGVSVSNANINWRDESSGQQLSIQQLNLQIGAIVPGQPVDLALDFIVENQTPAIKANIQLRGTPHLSVRMDQLNISKLVLSVDATGELLNGKPLKLKLETGVALNLLSQHLKLNDLQLDANGLLLSGDLEARDLANKPAFSGALKLAELNLREWLAVHEMPLPATADATALTRVALAMQLAGTANKLDITKLALMLDDSNLTGDLSIDKLASAMPAIGFNLNVDTIDLDRYLPPPADESSAAKTDKAAPAIQAPAAQTPPAPNLERQPEAELLPVALLRQLDINGLFHIGRLTVKKLLAEEVELKIKARGGHLKVEQQVKKFYQGNLQAAVTVDVRGKEPLLQITKQATNIQAEPLLQDLIDDGRLRGAGRFNADLKTRGNSEQAFRQHLDGDIGFRFEKGAVKGIDLAQTLRETWARIKGKPAPPASDKPETDFSELAGTATITQGVLVNEDLMAKSPFLRVDGKGQVDLVQEQLDYRLTTTIVKSMEGQGSSDMQDLMGVPVPVKISGSFANPKVRPDMDELGKQLLTGKVEQKIEEKLKGKLPDDVKEKLRGLFR